MSNLSVAAAARVYFTGGVPRQMPDRWPSSSSTTVSLRDVRL